MESWRVMEKVASDFLLEICDEVFPDCSKVNVDKWILVKSESQFCFCPLCLYYNMRSNLTRTYWLDILLWTYTSLNNLCYMLYKAVFYNVTVSFLIFPFYVSYDILLFKCATDYISHHKCDTGYHFTAFPSGPKHLCCCCWFGHCIVPKKSSYLALISQDRGNFAFLWRYRAEYG